MEKGTETMHSTMDITAILIKGYEFEFQQKYLFIHSSTNQCVEIKNKKILKTMQCHQMTSIQRHLGAIPNDLHIDIDVDINVNVYVHGVDHFPL